MMRTAPQSRASAFFIFTAIALVAIPAAIAAVSAAFAFAPPCMSAFESGAPGIFCGLGIMLRLNP